MQKSYASILARSGFPGGTVVWNLPASAGDIRDTGSIPWSGGSPAVGNGNPLEYSCLESSIDGGAGWAAAGGVTESAVTEQEHWLDCAASPLFSFLNHCCNKTSK